MEQNRQYPYAGKIFNGFLILFIALLLLGISVAMIVLSSSSVMGEGLGAIVATTAFIASVFFVSGLFTQQPNQCSVVIFFGKYKGTFDRTGFFWINPFCSRRKVSLRIRNMDIEPIKVNDKIGNPVLIGMVLVWKVSDTYKAVFDIDGNDAPLNAKVAGMDNRDKSLVNFVGIQSDAALREVTSHFAYDNDSDSLSRDELTLRSGGDEINERLEQKINERVAMAGICVIEARINYLAYAPEIAAVMLRRQQASAIISAREKIVEGAVTMVKMALDQLSREEVVVLDNERKAAMVSNLLVVLCADDAAQPVVNTGSGY